MLDTTVALGSRVGDVVRWGGSGFFYAYDHKTVPNMPEGGYLAYLVSNRHVFETLDDEAIVRVNPRGVGPAHQFRLPLKDSGGRILWRPHPRSTVDVAAMRIRLAALSFGGMQVDHFVNGRETVGSRDVLRAEGVSEGDGCFIFGFPLGITGGPRSAVIVRGGWIARIRDALHTGFDEYLIDSQAFPGNSGGPVVLKPDVVGEGKAGTRSMLIGIVRGYLPYSDYAVSVQTQNVRAIFEENTGLAVVHPVDCIQQTIEAFAAGTTLERLGAERATELEDLEVQLVSYEEQRSELLKRLGGDSREESGSENSSEGGKEPSEPSEPSEPEKPADE